MALIKGFPFYKQQDQMSSGPTCLRMIARYYGIVLSGKRLETLYNLRSGINLITLTEAAEVLGFRSTRTRLDIRQINEVELPCILNWREQEFVVLYKIKKGKYYLADPTIGLVSLDEKSFERQWFRSKINTKGIALLLTPTRFFSKDDDYRTKKISWFNILHYFKPFRWLFFQLLVGMAIGSILSLVVPFLTQSIVDVALNRSNISFVYLILISQVMLFLGSISIDIIRSWILFHISTRVNISILIDFLIKMMKLPLSFFENKTTGDILQRINDQGRIESFLTSTTLNTLFSIMNLGVFTIALVHYNGTIFLVSVCLTLLHATWIALFQKRRRDLNYRQFDNSSENQSAIVELVNGIQEIKMNNCEKQKRWSWERIQVRSFQLKVQNLSISQYQQGGSAFINQAKNILITFLSVKAVIDGHITLGGMMAIQYIVGQISSPVEQMLAFAQNYQDAKISLERLNEIYALADEEPIDKYFVQKLPHNKTLTVKNLSFSYPGSENDKVLKNIDIIIPHGKTTAIVGMSGSGKTTLLKILLRFYEIETGEVRVGTTNINQISFKIWRDECGTVLQDSFIFRDTIENNIAVGDDFPDKEKLRRAISIANLSNFIDELPHGLATRIGSGGNGISQGQKQRLLIARAVYKNPEYLFFDEATNALDSNNERAIMESLNEFFVGKTVIFVAHRLSSVKNADNIVVLDKGRVVEQGSHSELTALKGKYYELVKNQLEFEM
jgi:ATP-binding cassette subfamily B protein